MFKSQKKKAKAYSEYPRKEFRDDIMESTKGKKHKSGRGSMKKHNHPAK